MRRVVELLARGEDPSNTVITQLEWCRRVRRKCSYYDYKCLHCTAIVEQYQRCLVILRAVMKDMVLVSSDFVGYGVRLGRAGGDSVVGFFGLWKTLLVHGWSRGMLFRDEFVILKGD